MKRYRITELNRRLDDAFAEMEISWAIHREDRRDAAKLSRYLRALRRARRLHQLLKTI
jgi:hypothetical protein